MTRTIPVKAPKGTPPDMLLPAKRTCSDCRHCDRCTRIFGAKPGNTFCDFAPSRFDLEPEAFIPWTGPQPSTD